MEFNPTDLSYGALFLSMLIYVIRSNDSREKRYVETIDEQNSVIKEMVKSLNDNSEMKETIKAIKDKLWGVV